MTFSDEQIKILKDICLRAALRIDKPPSISTPFAINFLQFTGLALNPEDGLAPQQPKNRRRAQQRAENRPLTPQEVEANAHLAPQEVEANAHLAPQEVEANAHLAQLQAKNQHFIVNIPEQAAEDQQVAENQVGIARLIENLRNILGL